MTRALALGATIVLFLSVALDGADASPSLAPTAASTPTITRTPTPTGTPSGARRSSAAQPSQFGYYVVGTVWDDTPIRNGVFDDRERAIPGVTVTVELLDFPLVLDYCTTTNPPNVNPTDENGRHRCEVAPGQYRVTVNLPPGYEATTSLQREVTVTETEGAVADFGLAKLDRRIRSVGGVVFLDCNQNGRQDLPVEFRERPDSGYEIRLERVGGRGGEEPTSRRDNRYTFERLEVGTYVVTLRLTGSRYRATTETRREIDLDFIYGDMVDFGVYDARIGSDCERAANATATVIAEATATAAARATGTIAARTPPNAVGSPMVERQGGPTATPTPTGTATPPASQRLDSAYPRTARFLMQAVANPNGPNRIDMLAEGMLIGAEVEVVTSDGRRVGTEQLSMRIRRN